MLCGFDRRDEEPGQEMNRTAGSDRPRGLCAALWEASEGATGGDAMPAALGVGEAAESRGPRARCAVAGGVLASEGKVHGVLIGAPRWPGELAVLARERGDAAALLEGYRRHGEALPARLGGTFLFAVVDEEEGRLLAAVDRLGRLPLYWTANGERAAVASRPTALLALPGLAPELDPQGFYDYVFFHMIPAPGTIYHGIFKLQAGHALIRERGRTRTACYWRPEFRDAGVPEPELGEQLRAVIRDCVAREAAGEGVGAFLSGGLDSSTVCGMLSRVREEPARSYSIGFEAEGYDEMEYARVAVRYFGLEPHEYYVTPEDVVAAVPRIAAWYDEPFGNSSALPAFFCARMAREDGIVRLLAGDGGDELFAGNARYQEQGVFELYGRLPGWFRSSLFEPLLGALPPAGLLRRAQGYVRQANMPLPDRLHRYNFLYRHDPAEVFTDEFLSRVDTGRPWRELRQVWSRPERGGTLNRMLYFDWQYTLADNDLRKVTGMCEMAGVEVAYPLLDDELVDLSCRVPERWKMSRRELRRFYRRAMAGFLPPEIIHKSKHGFGLPFGVWLREHAPLRELGQENLVALKRRGIVRPDFIDRALELYRSDAASYYGELVWILMMLELWLESHGQ